MRAGMRTCLVESGCHSADLQSFFPRDRADYVAANLGELLPRECAPRVKLKKHGVQRILSCENDRSQTASLLRSRAGSVPELSQLDASSASFNAGHRPQTVAPSSLSHCGLRSWMLARGNLVYAAAANGGGSGGGGGDLPLMLKLHGFFDNKVRTHAWHAHLVVEEAHSWHGYDGHRQVLMPLVTTYACPSSPPMHAPRHHLCMPLVTTYACPLSPPMHSLVTTYAWPLSPPMHSLVTTYAWPLSPPRWSTASIPSAQKTCKRRCESWASQNRGLPPRSFPPRSLHSAGPRAKGIPAP